MKTEYVCYEIKDMRKIPKKIRMIMSLARSILDDKEISDWVWGHTRTEYAYDGFFDLIRSIANFTFVEWKIEQVKKIIAIDEETNEIVAEKETTEKKGLGFLLRALERQRGYKDFDIHEYDDHIKVYCRR